MKIKKSQLKELIRQSIKSVVSEVETVKFKDPDSGKEHEITMDTAKRYAQEVESGDSSKLKAAAVKAAQLKNSPDSSASAYGDEKPEPKKTKISANPFGGKDDEPKPKSGGEEYGSTGVMKGSLEGDEDAQQTFMGGIQGIGDVSDTDAGKKYPELAKMIDNLDNEDDKIKIFKHAMGDDWMGESKGRKGITLKEYFRLCDQV